MYKRMTLYLLAAMVLPFVATEAALRFLPSLLPYPMQVFTAKHLLYDRIFHPDSELGYVLRASGRWVIERGRVNMDMEHVPFPGSSNAGYRSRTPSPETADIVAVGDSHLYAPEVRVEETLTARLALGTGLRVANLGVPGYGTTQTVRSYQRYGSRLRPGLILMFVCYSDFWENVRYASWNVDRGSVELDGRNRNSLCVKKGLSVVACAAAKLLSLGLSGPLVARRFKSNPEIFHTPENLDILCRDIQEMKSQAQRERAGFAVILPEGNSGLRIDSQFHKSLTTFLEDRRIPTLDLQQALRGEALDTWTIRGDSHWHAAGHAWAAREILDFLVERKLIPGRKGAAPARAVR